MEDKKNGEEKSEDLDEEKKITSEGLTEEVEGRAEGAEEEAEKPILIVVDDDKKIRKLVKKTFKKEFDVVDLEDGKDCIKILIEEKPKLVLLDEDMPDDDGWSIVAKIEDEARYRHMWMKDMPVIILSENTPNLELLQRINIEKIVDYITKPLEKEDTEKRVDKLLKRLVKIEKIRDKARLGSFRVGEEYERISKALYLRQGLIKSVKEELKKIREEGDPEEIIKFERAINEQMGLINFYMGRTKEIEKLADGWEKEKNK